MKLSKKIALPLIVLITTLVVGRLTFSYLKSEESEKLNIRTQVTAEQVGIRLHEFLNTRLARLDFLRDRMENKPVLEEAEFRTRALFMQHELPGFQAINWVDEKGVIQWVTPLSTNLPVVGVDLIEAAAKGAAQTFSKSMIYQTDTATPFIELVQGGFGFALYLPIVVDDKTTGFINGVFRTEELISKCFANTIRDFNYEVILSGERIYLRGEPDNFISPRVIGRYNFTFLGQSWELQIVPGSSEKSTADLMSILSIVVTLMLSMLFAAFTYFKMKSKAELFEAHKILEDSEIKFRTIFDKSPACLLRFSTNGMVTDWNLAAASVFGFEFPPQLERDIYQVNEMEPIIPAINGALKGQDSEYTGSLHINGRDVEVDASFVTLVSGSDQIQGGIILLKDVTAQKQILNTREVMYEMGNLTNRIKDLPQLFEAIQNGLSSILDTRNFYVALYNEESDEFTYPYYKDEFDSAPPDPIKGEKGISAYIVKNAVPVLFSKEEIYALNREGKIDLLGTPAEQWLGCPLIVEGRPIGIMAVQSYSKEVIYDGNDMGMLSFVSDQIANTIKINIEDEKLRNSESMHRQLSNELRDSNNIKALLLDILSHDLKNPAGVISSVADLMMMEGPASDEVQLIKDSSDALLIVIENTTALARITLGEKIAMEALNISELAEQVSDEYKASFLGQGKSLEINIQPGLSGELNPIIAEVFRNYLSNALKYAPKGEDVIVSLEDEGHEICFYVSDLGTTITGEDVESIFQRSVQLENGKMRGSGLGLAIVKRIAEVHNAKVGVKPNSPKGNIFFIKFPKSIPGVD
ncbi:MAG: GAF domain-containing protein [Candidatus Marinimicrobia bacterium]|nr:GAF domain-containing protein [Candidatus Neomarinimicrobiota bacterium]